MPELPDVELFTRYFRATSLGRPVRSVKVLRARTVRGISAPEIERRFKGRKFVSACRHGKYLFAAAADDLFLVLHFGMTGSLRFIRDGTLPPYTRFAVVFTGGGTLALVDPRIFGTVTVTSSVDGFLRERRLGPDALALTPDAFRGILRASDAAVKVLLMDQGRLAGIGNIYSDEILFQARVHPAARSSALPETAVRALYDAMHLVLAEAIRRGADPARLPSDRFMLPRRSRDGACPRGCGPFAARTIGGRTAYFCPACQTIGGGRKPARVPSRR